MLVRVVHVQKKDKIVEQAYQLALSCLQLSAKKQKPDRQLCFLFADLLLQFGQVCFEESFLMSKQIFLAALNMHLYAIGLLNECIDMREFNSLEDLKKKGETLPRLFNNLEEWIVTTHSDHCMAAAYTDTFAQNEPKRRLFNFSQIVYWLGCCYQNVRQIQNQKRYQ